MMTTPVLFTHSYFQGGGAVMNSAADYISAAIVRPSGTFSEFADVDGTRYVFSFWLDHRHAVLVRPSDAVIAKWLELHGGVLTAFMPRRHHDNPVIRMEACMREVSGRAGFTWNAIAGDVSRDDLVDRLISLIGEDYRTDVVAHFTRKSNR